MTGVEVHMVEDPATADHPRQWLITVATPGAQRVVAACPYIQYADLVKRGIEQLEASQVEQTLRFEIAPH